MSICAIISSSSTDGIATRLVGVSGSMHDAATTTAIKPDGVDAEGAEAGGVDVGGLMVVVVMVLVVVGWVGEVD